MVLLLSSSFKSCNILYCVILSLQVMPVSFLTGALSVPSSKDLKESSLFLFNKNSKKE